MTDYSLSTNTYLLCKFAEERVVEIAAYKGTVRLYNNLIALAVLDNRALLTKGMDLLRIIKPHAIQIKQTAGSPRSGLPPAYQDPLL